MQETLTTSLSSLDLQKNTLRLVNREMSILCLFCFFLFSCYKSSFFSKINEVSVNPVVHRGKNQYKLTLFININQVYNIAGKFVKSNSIARACFIFLLCTLMTSANKSLEKKNFPSGWKCYQTIGSYVNCAFIEIWSTQEVWRTRKMRRGCSRRSRE